MEVKIGCDLISVKRFKKILKRTPAMRRRMFSPQEITGAPPEKLAGIFAAKEAVIKALDMPAGNWQNIEIFRNKTGKPGIRLSGDFAKKNLVCDLSISHDDGYVLAVVALLL